MSFLKQLLKPFVEFDEDAKANKEPGTTPDNPVATPSYPVTPPPTPSFTTTPATPAAPTTPATPAIDYNAKHPLITGADPVASTPAQPPAYSPSGTLSKPIPEHVRYFEHLIEEANNRNPLFQGADYKEFIDSKLDIDDITDEALKYKTALNVFKSSGLTKEKLLSTGQEYINLVGRDLNAFQSAQALQYQKEVRPKEEQIRKKAEELSALTQRINALKAEINQLTTDIDLAKEKLNTTKNSFLLAGENKQKEIQTELQKIAQYF